MNNKKLGNSFEQEWMNHLASLGMWVHFMQPAPDGSQPFDVISIDNAYGDTHVCAWDCKTLSGKRFPLSRIEDNQEMAFEALNKRGVYDTCFVIKSGDTVYIIPSRDAIERKHAGEKSILLEDRYVYMHLKQDNNS